jgi:alkanesulfonate monooxygenase SsuD/methylene tetrahydromethanopterin reductase-like flavin-dependent oxidoreductase (luciferase family)
VSRLRDYIESLRAIFHSFQTGETLNYAGPFYRFHRLQPYFNPGPIDHPVPQIWTGGVNKKMCVLAGELSDGFVCHPTNSHPLILISHTLPSIAEGAWGAPRSTPAPAVVANPQPMMAATRQALDALREARRAELAFLYSTPAYRRQLEYFGLGEVAEALSDTARRSKWSDLPKQLTDEVIKRVVPQGTYEEMSTVLTDWYSGLCAGLSLPVPADDEHDDHLTELVERCKAIPTSRRPVPF